MTTGTAEECCDLCKLLESVIEYLDLRDIAWLISSSKQLSEVCRKQLCKGPGFDLAHKLLRIAAADAGAAISSWQPTGSGSGTDSETEVDTARGTDHCQMVAQQFVGAAEWLLHMVYGERLFAASSHKVADTVSAIVTHVSGIIDLKQAKLLVALGFRVNYAQLVSAARQGLTSAHIWMQAQRELSVPTDMPDYARVLVYGSGGGGNLASEVTLAQDHACKVPDSLQPKELADLMFVAMNASGINVQLGQAMLKAASQHPANAELSECEVAAILKAAISRDVQHDSVKHGFGWASCLWGLPGFADPTSIVPGKLVQEYCEMSDVRVVARLLNRVPALENKAAELCESAVSKCLAAGRFEDAVYLLKASLLPAYMGVQLTAVNSWQLTADALCRLLTTALLKAAATKRLQGPALESVVSAVKIFPVPPTPDDVEHIVITVADAIECEVGASKPSRRQLRVLKCLRALPAAQHVQSARVKHLLH